MIHLIPDQKPSIRDQFPVLQLMLIPKIYDLHKEGKIMIRQNKK